MCDPIIDESEIVEEEPFRKETVEEYLKKRSRFRKFPLRHYSQIELPFEENTVKQLLTRLQIPVQDIVVTVFGGYTGQFASCLKNIGTRVIFTDPLIEWVDQARTLGFEAHQLTAEEIPKEIMRRTDLFATFECYEPFTRASRIYTAMRFLTSRYGIVFAESEMTRQETKAEGASGMLKFSFLSYAKVYSIRRVYRQKGRMRIYHFSADEETRKKIRRDCNVMQVLYDNFSSGTHLRWNNALESLASKVGMGKDAFLSSMQRIISLWQGRIPRVFTHFLPEGSFEIFSKRFRSDL